MRKEVKIEVVRFATDNGLFPDVQYFHHMEMNQTLKMARENENYFLLFEGEISYTIGKNLKQNTHNISLKMNLC